MSLVEVRCPNNHVFSHHVHAERLPHCPICGEEPQAKGNRVFVVTPHVSTAFVRAVDAVPARFSVHALLSALAFWALVTVAAGTGVVVLAVTDLQHSVARQQLACAPARTP